MSLLEPPSTLSKLIVILFLIFRPSYVFADKILCQDIFSEIPFLKKTTESKVLNQILSYPKEREQIIYSLHFKKNQLLQMLKSEERKGSLPREAIKIQLFKLEVLLMMIEMHRPLVQKEIRLLEASLSLAPSSIRKLRRNRFYQNILEQGQNIMVSLVIYWALAEIYELLFITDQKEIKVPLRDLLEDKNQ